MLLQFWRGAEVLGPPLSSHWFELGSLGIGVLHSSFSILGETWLSLSVLCDLRLGHAVTGRAWREESMGDVRYRGGIFQSPKAPTWLGPFLPGLSASPPG